jgi:hypothetical protein
VRVVAYEPVSETLLILSDHRFIDNRRNTVLIEGMQDQFSESQGRREQHDAEAESLMGQTVDNGRGAKGMGHNAADIQAAFRSQEGPDRVAELKIAGASALGGESSDPIRSYRFLPNQFRLFLHTAAYTLFWLLRDALKGTEFSNAQAGTLRLKLFKIGARIRETSRRAWIHMASGYPYQRPFASAVETLKTAPS